MKAAEKIVDVLIVVFIASALVPIIFVQITHTPNLTGASLAVWSILGVLVVIGVVVMIIKMLGTGGGR